MFKKKTKEVWHESNMISYCMSWLSENNASCKRYTAAGFQLQNVCTLQIWMQSTINSYHGNQSVLLHCHTPCPGNKASIIGLWIMMVHNPLIWRPYFLGTTKTWHEIRADPHHRKPKNKAPGILFCHRPKCPKVCFPSCPRQPGGSTNQPCYRKEGLQT